MNSVESIFREECRRRATAISPLSFVCWALAAAAFLAFVVGFLALLNL